MVKIEIRPEQAFIKTRSGVSKTGKSYTLQEQRAYAYLGGAYPVEFVINIPQGQPAYPAGVYELSPNSLQVGQFGRLEVAREIILLTITDKK